MAQLDWFALTQIILIDLLFCVDNALIIALACRELPASQRRYGIFWGMTGALGLRILLIYFTITAFKLPALKILGGLLLIGIAIKWMKLNPTAINISPTTQLSTAIKTIITADLVTSLDNVLGIASAIQTAPTEQHMALVIFSLCISVPILLWSSQLLLKLLDFFPWIVPISAVFLGCLGGGLIAQDPLTHTLFGGPITSIQNLIAHGMGGLSVIVFKVSLRKKIP